jgi:pimeloyl-ACP methyl ester carboxylesterase
MEGFPMGGLKMLCGAACLAVLAGTVGAQNWDPAPIAGSEDDGDKSRVPIVFVHGQNGAGDQFERQSMHFTSNGYPPSWIVPFDYNTAVRGDRSQFANREEGEPFTTTTTEDLDALVDAVRERTGFDKINLVGHSRGTFESAAYLSDPERAAKIAHYATIGGAEATNPNGVPSIAISGLGDFRPGPSASNGGQVGWMPAYQDHVMVCTSDESFWEVFTFFNDGEKPQTLQMAPEEKPQVAGYVKSYIHNKPLEGASVEVWPVEPATGQRMHDEPLCSFDVNAEGEWGPFSAKPGQPYEFVVHGTASEWPLRYYRTPFTHSDRFVYFRVAADHEDYAATPFSEKPELLNDKTAAFVVRHQNGSMVPGVVSLSIDGKELIKAPIVEVTKEARQSATVAVYIADGNGNGKTDLTTIDGFGGAFVSSADIFIPANETKSVQFKLNQHVLNVPALAGAKHGAISVVFEDFN